MAGDWIETFLAYSDGIPSPAIFRLWSAITVVAGALERRVWASSGRKITYPNLYTLLVAPPGVGKTQSVDLIMEIIYAAKGKDFDAFHIAPDSLTRASLVDTLATSNRLVKLPDGKMEQFSSLFVFSSEFGVLVPQHDLDMLSVLNRLWDNPRNHREKRRGNNLDIDIIKPTLNILAGTQPMFLGSMLPEEAWGMGFAARLMMVYSPIGPKIKLFSEQDPREDLKANLVAGLKRLSKTYGEVYWEEDVKQELEYLLETGFEPVPSHSKLGHYIARRVFYLMKLCIISAMSDGERYIIEMKDIIRAKVWLLDMEAVLPDIFRDMAGKSDVAVIQDLHYFMWSFYMKDKKPIPETKIYAWMTNKVSSEKIKYVLELAEKSGVLTRTATGQFIPKPKNEHGE